jgi:hypothetical protein
MLWPDLDQHDPRRLHEQGAQLPRFDMLPRIVRSPVEICFGTSPSHAPKSRPFENASPVPIAATMALEMIGPMPGTVISRSQPLSCRAQRFDLAGKALDALVEAQGQRQATQRPRRRQV